MLWLKLIHVSKRGPRAYWLYWLYIIDCYIYFLIIWWQNYVNYEHQMHLQFINRQTRQLIWKIIKYISQMDTNGNFRFILHIRQANMTNDIKLVNLCISCINGTRFNIKTVFPCIVIPIIRRGWHHDRLIFITGIPIHVRWNLYIETDKYNIITIHLLW